MYQNLYGYNYSYPTNVQSDWSFFPNNLNFSQYPFYQQNVPLNNALTPTFLILDQQQPIQQHHQSSYLNILNNKNDFPNQIEKLNEEVIFTQNNSNQVENEPEFATSRSQSNSNEDIVDQVMNKDFADHIYANEQISDNTTLKQGDVFPDFVHFKRKFEEYSQQT
ncbi:unnamed protein product [Brachionus calyciflorus]|uniref:Uncharacterized protein n=1 Tax=Brachionus calyciflorus TaxID=104777 RepID=A0A813X3T6_9BILA|nr:unnamed protein product [Brachionus calyciflorus]